MRKVKKLKAFMRGTDLFTEAWIEPKKFPELYRTIKELKAERNCWRECGIVEVEVKEVKWRRKGSL